MAILLPEFCIRSQEEENKDHQRCELLACGLLEDEQASVGLDQKRLWFPLGDPLVSLKSNSSELRLQKRHVRYEFGTQERHHANRKLQMGFGPVLQ